MKKQKLKGKQKKASLIRNMYRKQKKMRMAEGGK